jgi:hypothetical protein
VSLLPSSVSLYVGAAGSLTLNAAQLADTPVPVNADPSGLLSVPSSVTVPAGQLTVGIPLVGLSAGTTTVTAGPLTETSAQAAPP